ncbi:DUF3347 domain-containing protein [Pseudoflavitalea sp. X16]|uniref:DUF3347 domain-containing protein n=1 Tax=Paraflavitalea devenefica TaxID=2716334 RepID=UPI001423CB4A|nr:DUF3347 domain-containing protein [Paraflavitalea devenefica]NII26339.1 DUF3347 domain-containing protein [Paraflavitalea devenefica]
MKKIFFVSIAIASIVLVACNNSDNNKQAENHDMDSMKKDSAGQTTSMEEKDIKTVAVAYTNVDPKIAASINEIIDHYLHVKNALANDNGEEAVKGSKAMSSTLGKIDKSLFTAEQKKIYEENEEDLKEHAEHISKSKIEHQREHFSMMSEDVYALAKAFGGGKTLYHDHCPMYNNNKGAMWLSETMEIKNPYMGSKMPKCGKVEEKIQ